MLSTDQAPYAAISQLSSEKSKAHILRMLSTWTSFVGRLPEAYEYMRAHCPKKNSRCDESPPKEAEAARTVHIGM